MQFKESSIYNFLVIKIKMINDKLVNLKKIIRLKIIQLSQKFFDILIIFNAEHELLITRIENNKIKTLLLKSVFVSITFLYL